MFGWRQLLWASSAYTAFGRYLLAICTISLTVLLVDALQRRHEIGSSYVAVRILFWWRRRPLPVGVRPAIDHIGQVVVYDPAGEEALFTIPREYNLDGRLAERLNDFFHSRNAGA
jgi:hypothetical protein